MQAAAIDCGLRLAGTIGLVINESQMLFRAGTVLIDRMVLFLDYHYYLVPAAAIAGCKTGFHWNRRCSR